MEPYKIGKTSRQVCGLFVWALLATEYEVKHS